MVEKQCFGSGMFTLDPGSRIPEPKQKLFVFPFFVALNFTMDTGSGSATLWKKNVFCQNILRIGVCCEAVLSFQEIVCSDPGGEERLMGIPAQCTPLTRSKDM
jgi:hypothetical protein